MLAVNKEGTEPRIHDDNVPVITSNVHDLISRN